MDLAFLTEVYDGAGGHDRSKPGPFASVYLDTSQAVENADKESELRWQHQRHLLADQGADRATLEALNEAVAAYPPQVRSSGRVLVAAAGGRMLLDRELPAAPRRQIAAWAPLPHLMPLLAQSPDTVPHVVAVVDRIGAEVTAYGPRGRPVAGVEVEGEDHPIRKVQPGGWSQQRFQRRAENLWERNAKDVAERVDAMVESTGARLLVLAGDVRARGALLNALPTRSQALAVASEAGSRAPGASADSLRREVHRLVESARDAEYADLLATWASEYGRRDRAVDGMRAVVAALAEAQVQTLVIRDDPHSNAELWVGPEPLQLGTTPDGVRGLGVGEPVRARADAALVRAAVAGRVELVVLPEQGHPAADAIGAPRSSPLRAPADEDPETPGRTAGQAPAFRGGVAAVLRFADVSTTR
jgi:hypothetical protein